MTDTEPTRPSAETRSAEKADAQRTHTVDTADGAAAQSAPTAVDPEVGEHETEMNKRGANQKGEGRI